MNSELFGKPAPFRIGRVQAACAACGATEFVRSRRLRQEPADLLVCVGCGAEHLRSALMRQVTQQVMERADVLLKQSESLRVARPDDTAQSLGAKLKEAEELLRFPTIPGHVEKACKLLIAIARKAPGTAVRNAAMNAVTLAGHLGTPPPLAADAANLERLLGEIRRGLEGGERR